MLFYFCKSNALLGRLFNELTTEPKVIMFRKGFLFTIKDEMRVTFKTFSTDAHLNSILSFS